MKKVTSFLAVLLSLTILLSVSVYAYARKKIDISDAWITNLEASYVYTGKAVNPRVTVMADFTQTKDNGDGTISATTYFMFLQEGEDYTVTYKNNKNIGTATVIINGIGNYEGTLSAAYNILPQNIKIQKVSAGKKQMTITAGKAKGGCSYQFAYRKSGNKKWSYKNGKNRKKNIKRLVSGKTYCVKVRAFKKVEGKVYNGKWSTVKKKRVP